MNSLGILLPLLSIFIYVISYYSLIRFLQALTSPLQNYKTLLEWSLLLVLTSTVGYGIFKGVI